MSEIFQMLLRHPILITIGTFFLWAVLVYSKSNFAQFVRKLALWTYIITSFIVYPTFADGVYQTLGKLGVDSIFEKLFRAWTEQYYGTDWFCGFAYGFAFAIVIAAALFGLLKEKALARAAQKEANKKPRFTVIEEK